MGDNQLAIYMLRDVTEIINAIENNDVSYMMSNLSRLKLHISNFESVIHQNKTDGLYDNNIKL